MSRDPRRALLQDELIRSVEVGRVLAGTAAQMHDLEQARKRDEQITTVSALSSTFDADAEDAPTRFGVLQSMTSAMTAQERDQFLGHVSKSFEERRAVESEARRFGVNPVFVAGEDGAKRLDRYATLQAVTAAKVSMLEEEQTFLPDTHILKASLQNDPVFQNLDPGVQRSVLKEQNTMRVELNEALSRGVITPDEAQSVFKASQTASGQVSGLTGAESSGTLMGGAVMIDPQAFMGKVKPKLAASLKAEQSRARSTAVGAALESNVKVANSTLGALQSLLQKASSGEITLGDQETSELTTLYTTLAEQTVGNLNRAAAASVDAVVPMENTTTITREAARSAEVGQAAAEAAPIKVPISHPSLQGRQQQFSVGGKYNLPGVGVIQVTE
jgi:hypothetical protein